MNSNFEVELLSLLKLIARLKEAKHIKNKGIINTFSFKQARNRNSKFGPLDIFPCNSRGIAPPPISLCLSKAHHYFCDQSFISLKQSLKYPNETWSNFEKPSKSKINLFNSPLWLSIKASSKDWNNMHAPQLRKSKQTHLFFVHQTE